MSTFLTLASEYIERMVNPAHGVVVNEDYALRFGQFLGKEKAELESMLRDEAKRLSDSNALSAQGWIWYLNWASSEGIKLRDDLLLEITNKWNNVFIQSLAIQSATQHVEWDRPETSLTVYEFDNGFIQKLLTRCVQLPEGHEREQPKSDELKSSKEIRTDRAESTFLALLDVETDITFDAASTLLSHSWQGRHELVECYRQLWYRQDQETQKEWNALLRFEQQ